MRIKITVESLDTKLSLYREYMFDGSEYVSVPWEAVIPEMIEGVIQTDEPFKIKDNENL